MCLCGPLETRYPSNFNKLSIFDWVTYFKKLYSEHDPIKNSDLIDTNGKIFNKLGYTITDKEVISAIKSLRNQKSVGLDLVSNEMLKYSQHIMLPILVKAFNAILLSRKYPSRWCKGYIVPIFKGGSTLDPANYRGITVFSCLAKLFNTILAKRIEAFTEEQKHIDMRQIGFKKDRRTADHMFMFICLTASDRKSVV